MILLLSGEGPSDIGTLNHDESFRPGPMAWFVDKIVETVWDFSPLETSAVEFISEGTLSKKSRSAPKAMVIRSKKRPEKGAAHFFKNARAMARLAQEREKEESCEVASVLFRDADGTRSTRKGLWEAKVKSIEDGFAADQYEKGVPMVPKPKSEAWLICALQPTPYQNCERLETDLSGNDNAPRPAKTVLEEHMQRLGEGEFSVEAVNEWIADGTIDTKQIDMPSYDHFKERLLVVARNMMGLTGPTRTGS